LIHFYKRFTGKIRISTGQLYATEAFKSIPAL